MNIEEFSQKYFEFLNTELAGLNLTAIKEYDEFRVKQIADSIGPLEQSDFFKSVMDLEQPHIDIGFGGGFPILPLAYKLPDKKFLGFEARKKKADAVTKIADFLDIKNVTLQHARIEDILIDIPCSMSLKAVGPIGPFLSKIAPIEPVTVFFYKGPNFMKDEGEQIQEVIKHWELVCNEEVKVTGCDKRVIVGFKNKNVPRGTTKLSKNKNGQGLVKLSSFL